MNVLNKADFDGKVVTSIKDHISMTVYNGQLAVLNMVTFDLASEKKEIEKNDFFASMQPTFYW